MNANTEWWRGVSKRESVKLTGGEWIAFWVTLVVMAWLSVSGAVSVYEQIARAVRWAL